MSASSKTTTGALPPSSRWTRLTSAAAALATAMPAPHGPGDGHHGRGRVRDHGARPVSRSPSTTFSTPGGRCSAAISASSAVVAGVVSDGLSTTVLPAASAGPNFQTRHHHRVVPGRHLADDSDGLAANERRVPRQVLAGRLALQQSGCAGEEPYLVHHRADLFAQGQGRSACPCSRSPARQLLAVGLDGVGELEQGELTLARGGVPPAVEGRLTQRHTRCPRPRAPERAAAHIPRRSAG